MTHHLARLTLSLATFVLTVGAPAAQAPNEVASKAPAHAKVAAATTAHVAATSGGTPAQPAVTAAQPAGSGSLAGKQYSRLVIRNAMLINGRGTPTEGPVDIVIDKDTIADIIPTDGVSMRSYGATWRRPEGDRVIDATGMYVMPGLIDMHTHVPGTRRGGADESDYAYKLWLAHGVTTLRDAGADAGIEKMVKDRGMSAANQIIAPRLFLYERWPNVSRQREHGHTPEEARELVRTFKARGADGVKVSKGPGQFPDIIDAICDEAQKQGMRGVMVDLKVSETDALVAANAGVRSLEHYYGVPTRRFPAHSTSRPTTTTGTRSIGSGGRASCGRKRRSIPRTSRRSSTG